MKANHRTSILGVQHLVCTNVPFFVILSIKHAKWLKGLYNITNEMEQLFLYWHVPSQKKALHNMSYIKVEFTIFNLTLHTSCPDKHIFILSCVKKKNQFLVCS